MALRDALGFPVAARLSGLDLPAASSAPPEAPGATMVTAAWERAGPLPALSAAKLKALVRNGVPMSQRADLWLTASGGAAMKAAAAPDMYTCLAGGASGLPPMVLKQIQADAVNVGTTWRSHPLLSKPEPLFRILVAVVNHCPTAMVYSRTLCHMAAFTLVVFGGASRQEDVFWTLAALLQERLFGYCQGQWLLGVRVEQEVLGGLAARKLPRLAAHLATMRLSLATFTQPWLAGLYVGSLPPETLARVWDCMMVEGPKPLLRVGLALLKMYEQTIASCTVPDVLRRCLDLRVARTTDAAGLLHTAFRGIGSLPGDQVSSLRATALRAALPPGDAPPPPALPTGARAGLAALGLTRRSPDAPPPAAPVSPAGSSGSELLTPTLAEVVGAEGAVHVRTLSGPPGSASSSSVPSGSTSPARSSRHVKRGSMGSLSALIAKLGWGGGGSGGSPLADTAAVGAAPTPVVPGLPPGPPRASSLRRNATTSSMPSLAAC